MKRTYEKLSRSEISLSYYLWNIYVSQSSSLVINTIASLESSLQLLAVGFWAYEASGLDFYWFCYSAVDSRKTVLIEQIQTDKLSTN